MINILQIEISHCWVFLNNSATLKTVTLEFYSIPGQSSLKKNCYNSRASDDIDIKLRPVTKIDKKIKQHQR